MLRYLKFHNKIARTHINRVRLDLELAVLSVFLMSQPTFEWLLRKLLHD